MNTSFLRSFIRLDVAISCALVFATAYGLFYVPLNFDFLSPLKQAIGDFDITDIAQSKLRDDDALTVDTSIVLVNIGSLGRGDVAQMIERIAAEQPRVIGVDAFFRNPKEHESDSLLAAAIRNAGNVVLVSKILYNDSLETFTGVEYSNPMFTPSATGYANFITDQEHSYRTVREFTLGETVNGSYSPSFPAALARSIAPAAVDSFMVRGNSTEMIRFRGNADKFYLFDHSQILDPESDLSVLNGKIIVMGYMGEEISSEPLSLEDVFFTPINERYAGKSFPDMYGVTVHANIISQIIHRRYINIMPFWMTVIASIMLCYLNIVVFDWLAERESKWYDTYTIVTILAQTLGLTYVMVIIFHLYHYKLNITLILAVLALTPTVHEIYHNTIKPLVMEARMRYRIRKGRLAQSASHTVIMILLVFTGLCVHTTSVYAQDAKVLSVRGKVTVKGKPARTGMQLSASDKITVGDSKSAITLTFKNGKSAEVKSATTVSVSDLIARSGTNTSVSKKFASYVYNELTETGDAPNTDSHKKNMSVTGSVERGVGDRRTNVDALFDVLSQTGVTDGSQSMMNNDVRQAAESVLQDNAINAIVPHASYLLDPDVTFVWNSVSGTAEYRVRMIDANGTQLWAQQTRDTVLVTNMISNGLERGKNYYWSVAVVGKESVHSPEYCLHLLPDAQVAVINDTLAQIERELGMTPYANIIKAQYAEDSGAHVAALNNYSEAVRDTQNEDYKRYFRNYLRRCNIGSNPKRTK
ncbi:MAG: CHASE2 domain-containing protein [Candidatus Kapabacteria bacterium]|nr:CHASE2 domain-containing protein [Candidatus Kapabacteria bacterium]